MVEYLGGHQNTFNYYNIGAEKARREKMESKKIRATIEKLQGQPYKYKEGEIKQMLLNSNHAVERGIVAIWKRQTEDEKAAEQTRKKNNIGFSAFHARRGTYYANWINSGRHLSGKHVDLGRKLILHYTNQLTKISNKEVA